MSSKVFRRIPASDPALVEEAGRYGVADLHESMEIVPGRMALLSDRIRPLNPGLRISGLAATAYNYPGDGLMIHKAVQLCQPGQVLVFANNGCGPSLMFGELVGLAALKNGCAGVIVDGSIRDADALRDMNFPIWCTSVFAAHAEKRGPGAINVPIVCGGVLVQPGDTIVADGDGVICIPRADLAATVRGARERAVRETTIRSRIAAGETLFDIMNLQASAEAAGIEESMTSWNGED